MSYGTELWGLDLYGSTFTFEARSAVAASTHSVYVTFSMPVRAVSPLSVGDALRNSTWAITGVGFTDTKSIVAVRIIGDRRVELVCSTPFKSSNYVYKVSFTELMNSSRVYISPPYDLEFRGVVQEDHRQNEPLRHFDLKNDAGLLGGSMNVTAGGTYERVYGEDLIRKMVYRRLTTMPGSFFHLNKDDFGIGLKSKELLRISAIPTLKRRIEDEINKEPNVLSSTATIELSGGNLSIKLNVRTDQGLYEVIVVAR